MANERPSGCLMLLVSLLGGGAGGGKGQAESKHPYRKKEYFFSKAEAAFFEVLSEAVGQEYLIFAKVRMCDVIDVAAKCDNRQGARNKIQSKHIDFLLCQRGPIKPCLAIELDDSSHEQEQRKERDEFVDEAFNAAGVALLHVRVRRSYERSEVYEQIVGAIKRGD